MDTEEIGDQGLNINSAKTAILVDSACDLPKRFIKENNVFVIPINFSFGNERLKDERDEELTIRFYKNYSRRKNTDISSRPSTPDQIRNFILRYIANDYDYALILCISSTRSETYRNAVVAKDTLSGVLHGLNGLEGFRLKDIDVVDTRTLFSGQGVVAYSAVKILQMKPGLSTAAVARGVSRIAPSIKTYLVLKDLFYAKRRGKLRNDRSIGFLTYALGKTLNIKPVLLVQDGKTEKIAKCRGFNSALEKLFSIARNDIAEGIGIPAVMVSFAGALEGLLENPMFNDFEAFAKERGVSVHISVMSTSAGIYVGPGAVSLSYCS